NVWGDDKNAIVGQPFKIWMDIGTPKKTDLVSSMSFLEPDWSDESSIRLMVSLSSVTCEVEPGWQELDLPRLGRSDTVKFTLVASAEGEHEFLIRIYLAKRMLILQSFSFLVNVMPVLTAMVA